jgi:hypothetical protein
VGEATVSLDAFDVPFLGTPDRLVHLWTPAGAANAPLTSARQRAAMRRELRGHAPLALGRVRGGAGRRDTIDDELFVIDLPEGPFEYALVRIAYDARWRRCRWAFDARAAGFPSPEVAAQAMLHEVFAHWRIDLAHADNAAYARLLAAVAVGAVDAEPQDDDAA